jgi:AcrR family transcriptional regulator
MGRKPVDKVRTQDHLLKKGWIQSLTTLFLQQGISKFTMEDIANRLTISKATLYKYYASREEILDEIVRLKLLEIEAFETQLHDDQITFSERYFEVIKNASVLLAEFSSPFLQDIRQKYPELWEKIHAFQQRALLAAEKFYQQGIHKNIMNDINPRLLALTDKIFINAVANPSFLKDYGLSLQEAFDGFFQMKSKGIFK